MKKIPSLFKRDYEGTRLVYDEVVPGCEWVLDGEGMATVKLDGTSCLIRDGHLYRRYELKPGKQEPDGFIPAQDPDPITGKQPGWVPVQTESKADRWHIEALGRMPLVVDGTYELVGPKVQGNPHGCDFHFLERHGRDFLFQDVKRTKRERTFESVRQMLEDVTEFEGVVFWRDINDPDCDKCKIKRRDFGLAWPPADDTA